MIVDLKDEEIDAIKIAINNPTFAIAANEEVRRSIWKKLEGSK